VPNQESPCCPRQRNDVIASEVIDILQTHDGSGNVREFQRAIKSAMIHATRAALTPDCFPQSCHPAQSTASPIANIGLPTVGLAERFRGEFDLIEFIRQQFKIVAEGV
jgi:DNA-binding NtrC family response regulator